MSITITSCEKVRDEIKVENRILFGDKNDVLLKNLNGPAEIKSEGGTISYMLRPYTSAVPGQYTYSKIRVSDGGDGNDDGYFHLMHHSRYSGEKIGKYVLNCDVSDFRDPNVWSRYDWCHWRNWGNDEHSDDENVHDENSEGEDLINENCGENSDYGNSENENSDEAEYVQGIPQTDNLPKTSHYENSDDENSDDKSHEVEAPVIRSVYFVSVSDTNEKIESVELSADCIQADWYYGFRLTDPDTNLAYAYGFGDVLVNFLLDGTITREDHLSLATDPSDFKLE